MQLRDACVSQMGFTARSRFEPATSGGVRVIQLKDLSEGRTVDASALSCVRIDERIERYTVSAGDVLFRSRGELNVAVALDARFSEPAVAVLPLMILRPNRAIVLPEYLAWAINRPSAKRQLGANAQGTNLRMVPKSTLDALEIDVPDLATQRRIVAIANLSAREEMLLHQLAKTRRSLINQQLAERAKGTRSVTTKKERRA